MATFHYVPLHTSSYGAKVGRCVGSMAHTQDLPQRLVRLPVWVGMTQDHVAQTIKSIEAFFS